jgi:hypothetical protein
VLVDGFKRVRIATDRGDTAIWVRRLAIDATAAKVAMIASTDRSAGCIWIVSVVGQEISERERAL